VEVRNRKKAQKGEVTVVWVKPTAPKTRHPLGTLAGAKTAVEKSPKRGDDHSCSEEEGRR